MVSALDRRVRGEESRCSLNSFPLRSPLPPPVRACSSAPPPPTMSRLARQLGFLDRNELALVLDQRSPRGHDWRGLADKMGFSYTLIVALEQKESPTITLLEEWERKLG